MSCLFHRHFHNQLGLMNGRWYTSTSRILIVKKIILPDIDQRALPTTENAILMAIGSATAEMLTPGSGIIKTIPICNLHQVCFRCRTEELRIMVMPSRRLYRLTSLRELAAKAGQLKYTHRTMKLLLIIHLRLRSISLA